MQQLKTKDPLARLALILIIGLAIFLRLYRLDSVPPGWRDDELINSTVISQRAIDGDIRVYYDDASGHEGLYHILNAPFLNAFGVSPAGIRWLSVIMGVMTLIFTYMLGKELFGNRWLALLATAALTVSFWSLMYSRTGIRHIALPWLVLPSFYCFWQGINAGIRDSEKEQKSPNSQNKTAAPSLFSLPINLDSFRLTDQLRSFFFSGLWLGIAFYTYFASRGVPLIFIAFAIYLLIAGRPWLKRYWQGIVLSLIVALFVGIPLYQTLQQQPDAEARVAELAVPIVEAQAGNFEPLWEHIVVTLGMFHATGDGEHLYNIPDRPLFGPTAALFFWLGIAWALWLTLRPLLPNQTMTKESAVAAFLLLWWAAGISPAFLSIPPASLSHTILAQPAVYLILALPFVPLSQKLTDWHIPYARNIVIALAAVVLLETSIRDLNDYFIEWPNAGLTEFLYRTPLREIGNEIREGDEVTEFAITSLLNGPWDRIALQAALKTDETELNGRLYQPERVLILEPSITYFNSPRTLNPIELDKYESQSATSTEFRMAQINTSEWEIDQPLQNCFDNGFCIQSADYLAEAGELDLIFEVGKPLVLPFMPLISNPPPPGIYAGPRLHVFAQLLTNDGEFISGDDGLWVDVTTLEVGDIFLQRHFLPEPESADYKIAVGFYDPMNGNRILLEDGRDHLIIPATSE